MALAILAKCSSAAWLKTRTCRTLGSDRPLRRHGRPGIFGAPWRTAAAMPIAHRAAIVFLMCVIRRRMERPDYACRVRGTDVRRTPFACKSKREPDGGYRSVWRI